MPDQLASVAVSLSVLGVACSVQLELCDVQSLFDP
jgi:hypothetical protein